MSEGKSFGKLIREAREQLGWTQDEVADKLKVARGTVNRWEQDVQRPADRFLKQLIDALDLNEQEAYTLYYAGGKTPPERKNLPLSNRFFTGRETYLTKLRELLEKHHIVALSGLAGIGKTQIALEHAYRNHPDVYPTALWVNAADTAMLEADFASLAKTLKLPQKDEQKLEPRIEAVKEWLEAHTCWLLVIDNADELPVVRPFLPSKPHGYIVLTTRWQFPDEFAEPLTIEAMDTEDGRQFLLRRTNRSPDGAELDAVDQLMGVLGGLALALDQAGAYIRETGASFADYLKLYEENRRSLLDQHGPLNDVHSEHPLTVAATFQASFARVREITPLAEDILHFCAFLQPDAIPAELFQHDDSLKVDPMIFQKGIAALQRYSLIKYKDQENTLSLHRLVQAVVMDEMPPNFKQQWRARVLRTICTKFTAVTSRNQYNPWLMSRLRPHVLMCTTWEEDESTFMLDVAELSLALVVHLNYGWYTVAASLLKQSIEIRERYLGTNHPDTLLSLLHLARNYWSRRNYEQAELLCEVTLPLFERRWGLEYVCTEMCLEVLVDSYYKQGKIEQAVSLWQRVLSDREQRLGTEHLEVALALRRMAALYAVVPGKLAESESLYLRAMAILEKLQLDVLYYTGELPQLVSQALRDQCSGELTLASQEKIRKEVSWNLEGQIEWGYWPESKLPDDKIGYGKMLFRKKQDAEAATLEANDEPSE